MCSVAFQIARDCLRSETSWDAARSPFPKGFSPYVINISTHRPNLYKIVIIYKLYYLAVLEFSLKQNNEHDSNLNDSRYDYQYYTMCFVNECISFSISTIRIIIILLTYYVIFWTVEFVIYIICFWYLYDTHILFAQQISSGCEYSSTKSYLIDRDSGIIYCLSI